MKFDPRMYEIEVSYEVEGMLFPRLPATDEAIDKIMDEAGGHWVESGSGWGMRNLSYRIKGKANAEAAVNKVLNQLFSNIDADDVSYYWAPRSMIMWLWFVGRERDFKEYFTWCRDWWIGKGHAFADGLARQTRRSYR